MTYNDRSWYRTSLTFCKNERGVGLTQIIVVFVDHEHLVRLNVSLLSISRGLLLLAECIAVKSQVLRYTLLFLHGYARIACPRSQPTDHRTFFDHNIIAAGKIVVHIFMPELPFRH